MTKTGTTIIIMVVMVDGVIMMEVSFRWEGPFKGVSRSIVTRCLRQATDMPSHSRALRGHFFFFFPFFPLAISPF